VSTDERDRPGDEAGGNWILDTLGPTLRRVAEQQAAAEEHARTCTDRPCERCERYVCRSCPAPVDGSRECRACADAADRERYLRPTHQSIPPRFKWAIGARPELVMERVRGSAELVRRGLASPPASSMLLVGPTAAGKTSLAVAMLDAWVRAEPYARRGSLFVEAAWLARARARHRLGADEAPLVRDCLTAPLLLLDDLGQEREDRDGCITDVVYGRSNAELPTWVTCGLTTRDATLEAFAEKLSQRYDGGFVRRLLEYGKRVTLGAK
jgi:hypothetical protein